MIRIANGTPNRPPVQSYRAATAKERSPNARSPPMIRIANGAPLTTFWRKNDVVKLFG